jgi:glutamine amidotransferase
MRTVAVVDYGMCNLDSVMRAVEECGGEPFLARGVDGLKDASRIILPGVGAFGDAAEELRKRGLQEALPELVLERGVPFLGICLGMQLMASHGEEGGDSRGLGLIEGRVRRLQPASAQERVPHVGWNELHPVREHALLAGLEKRDFYFVHSFHLECANESDVLARTPFGGGFVSAVSRGRNIMGVQFHPEKSQKAGFQLLRQFVALDV